MVHPGAGGVSNPLHAGEAVSPWTRHQERAHRLSARLEQPSAGGHYMGEGILHVSASLFLTTMELRMMMVILLVSMLNLTWSHTNLI